MVSPRLSRASLANLKATGGGKMLFRGLRRETKWAGAAVATAAGAGFLIGVGWGQDAGPAAITISVGLLILAVMLTGYGWTTGRGFGFGSLLATGSATAGLGVLSLWVALAALYAGWGLAGRPPAAVHGDETWERTLFLSALFWGCAGMVLGILCGLAGALAGGAMRLAGRDRSHTGTRRLG